MRTGKNAQILAIANQKGGVGKTTTAVNLATALAANGQRMLIVDIDPQGNATTGLGLTAERRETGTYELLAGRALLPEGVVPTGIPGLDIMPGSVDLSGAEVELAGAERRQYRLKDVLQTLRKNYDQILIDCPPALGLLTLNALCAADAVLVPLQCEFYALEGLSHLMRTVKTVREAFNARLDIQGVVLTMYDRRNNLSAMVESDVRTHFGDRVYQTVIPRNVRVSEAPSHGKPVLLYDVRSTGARAYVDLAREILKKL